LYSQGQPNNNPIKNAAILMLSEHAFFDHNEVRDGTDVFLTRLQIHEDILGYSPSTRNPSQPTTFEQAMGISI
jgi:hypothetical protein